MQAVNVKRDTRIIFLVLIAIFISFILISNQVYQVQYGYTLRSVALGGALLGAFSGMIGCFAVLRRQSLMGDALSHAALPGVALAFLVAGRALPVLLIGAAAAGWVAVQFITSITRTTRIKQDTAMGMALAAFFAMGIVLLSYIQQRPDASQAGLDKFIFGQAAAIVQSDILLVAAVGSASLLVLALFWKEFKLITFDPEFARANGFRLRLLEAMLSSLIVVAIVLGLQLAGVILMVGMLIAPAVAARQWTNDLGQMLILAGAFGAFGGASGAIISGVDVGMPTGPLIIVVMFLIVALSISFAPERGFIWSQLRQRRIQRRFASQNVLGDIYQHAQQHKDLSYPSPAKLLQNLRGPMANGAIQSLSHDGLIEAAGEGWRLTEDGIHHAEDAIENQALWDLYRQHHVELGLPTLPEDRQQDIHALLPAKALDALRQMGRGMVPQ